VSTAPLATISSFCSRIGFVELGANIHPTFVLVYAIIAVASGVVVAVVGVYAVVTVAT
jgi:hypothetical protein